MDKTLKERQARWRHKQKERGRKAITVTLPENLIEALQRGRKNERQTMSAYVERLLMGGLQANNEGPQKSFPADSAEIAEYFKRDIEAEDRADRLDSAKRYIDLLLSEGKTWGAIAKCLNEENYPTLDGKSRWTWQNLKKIHRNGARNRFLQYYALRKSKAAPDEHLQQKNFRTPNP